MNINQGKRSLPPRIVLLGVEKIGKSTWASNAPNPVFLPIKGEEGIDDLDVASFDVSNTFGDVLARIGELFTEEHNYQTVVIDSASTLEPLIWKDTAAAFGVETIEKVHGGYGKGYIEALPFWRQLLDGLDALRAHRQMGSIIIGHVKAKRFNDPTTDPYDRYQFDIQEQAENLLYRWADAVFFANRKVLAKEVKTGKGKEAVSTHAVSVGDEPVLLTRKRPSHPGGGRGVYGQLPYELPLRYSALVEAVANIKKF